MLRAPACRVTAILEFSSLIARLSAYSPGGEGFADPDSRTSLRSFGGSQIYEIDRDIDTKTVPDWDLANSGPQLSSELPFAYRFQAIDEGTVSTLSWTVLRVSRLCSFLRLLANVWRQQWTIDVLKATHKDCGQCGQRCCRGRSVGDIR